jgi:hypothetical protein
MTFSSLSNSSGIFPIAITSIGRDCLLISTMAPYNKKNTFNYKLNLLVAKEFPNIRYYNIHSHESKAVHMNSFIAVTGLAEMRKCYQFLIIYFKSLIKNPELYIN